jgi:hypothetical protein
MKDLRIKRSRLIGEHVENKPDVVNKVSIHEGDTRVIVTDEIKDDKSLVWSNVTCSNYCVVCHPKISYAFYIYNGKSLCRTCFQENKSGVN